MEVTPAIVPQEEHLKCEKKFISVSFAFTRIEHAIESIVNHGLTKYIYIYTSASIIANSARRKSPGSRDRDIIPQYFYEYPMHKERERVRESAFLSRGIRGHSRVKGEG